MVPHPSRGTALRALGAAALAPALAGRAAAATPLHVSTLPIFDVAPFYAGVAQGYFAKEGLEVSTDSLAGGGAAGIPALVGGSYDIVYSNGVSNVLAIQRGIDLRFVVSGSTIPSKPPDQGTLMALKGSGLKTGKDLEGKVIGTNSVRSLMWAVDWVWVKRNGGDPSKVQFVEIPLQSMIDAIKAKKVDAALLLEPFMTMGLADPALEVVGYPFSTAFAGGSGGYWVTTTEIADKKRDAIRAFQRGMRAGAGWVNANLGRQPYVDLLASFTKIDPAVIKRMALYRADETVTKKGLDVLMNLMVETQLVSKPIDLTKYIFT